MKNNIIIMAALVVGAVLFASFDQGSYARAQLHADLVTQNQAQAAQATISTAKVLLTRVLVGVGVSFVFAALSWGAGEIRKRKAGHWRAFEKRRAAPKAKRLAAGPKKQDINQALLSQLLNELRSRDGR